MTERLNGASEDYELTGLWIKSLRNVKRFGQEPMIHRTDDYLHVLRTGGIALIIAKACSVSGYGINGDFIKKVLRMAHHHDDQETDPTIGDIPSPVKRAMTSKEKDELKRKEIAVIRKLAPFFIEPNSQESYLKDHKELSQKQIMEVQIVDLADKIDGLCETLHEIRCGNERFYAILEKYQEIFKDLEEKYSIYEIVVNDPDIQLHVPTREEVDRMSKISSGILLEEDGWRKFWTIAFDSRLPVFYRYWMRLTDGGLFYVPPSIIFSGWQLELNEASGRNAKNMTLEALERERLFFKDIHF